MKIYSEHVFCNYTHGLFFRFDVAGAGASLKRYSDPSFFKTESNMLEMDVSIEKKPRRVKVSKKGQPSPRFYFKKLSQCCFSLCPAYLVSLPTRLCYAQTENVKLAATLPFQKLKVMVVPIMVTMLS
jgi:hypothetical protein